MAKKGSAPTGTFDVGGTRRAKIAAFGLPAVALSLGLYRASRNGEFAAVDPTLQKSYDNRLRSIRLALAGGSEQQVRFPPPPLRISWKGLSGKPRYFHAHRLIL